MQVNTNAIAQVSPFLSAQKTANDIGIATTKLANDQIAAQGAAALALIQAAPQAETNLANNIDVFA